MFKILSNKFLSNAFLALLAVTIMNSESTSRRYGKLDPAPAVTRRLREQANRDRDDKALAERHARDQTNIIRPHFKQS